MKKIKFHIITKKGNDGMLDIVIVAEKNHQSAEFYSGARIFPGQWDSEAAIVVDNPNSNHLNKYVRKTLYELETMEFDYKGDMPISALLRAWEDQDMTHDFYQMIEHCIPRRDTRPSTKNNHWYFLRMIKKYRPTCLFSDLTEEFTKGFYHWLLKQGQSENTAKKNIRVFKVFWNYARNRYGTKIDDSIFNWYHGAQTKHYTRHGLEDEDIRIMENYVITPGTPKKHIEVLEQFLFMSYTGCRFSDFNALTRDNFKIENGKMWMEYTSIKTCTFARIPIWLMFDGRAEQLVYKHWDDLPAFFHTRCNGHFNGVLHKIGDILHLNKYISAHIARHTCACRLVNKEVPITTIQKVIGHRQIRMTMEYAQTSESTLLHHLMK